MANALDIIQVVVEFALFGQQLLNVYHAVCADPVTDADVMSDLMRRLDSAYDEVASAQTDQLVAMDLKFKNLTLNVDIGTDTFLSYPGGSEATSDPLPPGIAMCVTFPTSVLKSRGRKFLPGFCEFVTTDGLWAGSAVTQAADFGALLAGSFVGIASGSAWNFGVVQSDGSFNGYTSVSTSNVPAYQRRRKQGVGA